MMTREEMIKVLREGICRVIFTKINGEERNMPCTLAIDLIPENHRPKNPSSYDESVIRAYNTEIGEFRSFKVANVISIYPAE